MYTRTQIKRMKVDELKRLAYDCGLPVCRDFSKSDLVDILTTRMTANLEEPIGHAATRACENSGQ